MERGRGRALGFGRRRLGGEEHEVEVAVRRHFAAPGPAQRNQREPLVERRADHPLADEVIGKPNELVVKECRRLGGGSAAAGLLGEAPRDLVAPAAQRVAQERRGLAVELLTRTQRREPVGDRPAIDDRSAILDVEKAHRSLASRFSR